MGILDTTKLALKARQAQKKMKKMEVVGSDDKDIFRVLLNGLGEVVATELNVESLSSELGDELTSEQLEKLKTIIEDSVKQAMQTAKKNLEKEIASSTSLDDLKDLFS
ncbi:MAG: hypothetical protein KatS3mg085_364 [Candidatus Dojkabacteria bacterium]|nr:MAG: hypothetical protein KatS3mg085_364 [Candidatus Dojkabacteria bacterium]